MSDKVWQRDDNWVGSQIEDNFVMVNIDTGKYVALNATASVVWDALEQPQSEAQIEAALRDRFAVDEDSCKASVAKLLERMSELQLAEVH